jgi:hypothetical protein
MAVGLGVLPFFMDFGSFCMCVLSIALEHEVFTKGSENANECL